MPFIKAKVSCPISETQEVELKSGMGKAIELVPGKSEDYLLLEFEDNCRLWLRGRNEAPEAYPIAYSDRIYRGRDLRE